LVKNLGKEHTIILSSHILAEVSSICERVIIINKGEIAAIDTPQNLAHNLMSVERFLIRIKGSQDQVTGLIKGIKGVIKVEDDSSNNPKNSGLFDYVIENEKSVDVKSPLFFALANLGFVIYEMRTLDISLEDVFLQLTAEENTNVGVSS
jgi:ABC-2 type transport system ATP-binding protein